MSERGHLRVVAALVLVVVSCTTAPTPSAPIARPSAAPITATAPPIAAESSELPVACPSLDKGYLPPAIAVGTDPGEFNASAIVTSVTSRADPARHIRPLPDYSFPGTGLLVGGHDVRLWMSSYFVGYRGPIEPVAVTAELYDASGRSLQQTLPARFVTTGAGESLAAVFAVPNADQQSVLALHLTWRDVCFKFVAAVTQDVQIASTAKTASCSLLSQAQPFVDELAETFGPPLLVGNDQVPLSWRYASARYAPIRADSPFGEKATTSRYWDPSRQAITARPDAVLTVRNTNQAIKLDDGLYERVLRRRDALAQLRSNPVLDYEIPLAYVDLLDPGRDGTYRIKMPHEPGRYVVWLNTGFTSTCARGTALSLFSVDIEG